MKNKLSKKEIIAVKIYNFLDDYDDCPNNLNIDDINSVRNNMFIKTIVSIIDGSNNK